MKQKLHFIAIILIALSTPVRAYDFYDVTPAGDTLYYNVISGDAWVTYDNIDFADYPIFVAPNGGLINEQGLPVGTYQNLSGNLVIPSSVSNEFGEVFNVVGIDHYAFYGCHGLISVTMPATITQMGMNAFERCPNLVSVQLSSSLEAINVQDFQHCKSLSTINIPNTCTSIGTNAFLGCSSLASLVIPNSVISIGDLAFGDCTALASLNIGSGITDLNYAFSGCTGLTSISVAGNNPIFDSRNNCNAVIETYTNTLVLGCRTTIIPNSVTAIGGMAFRTSPDTVVIPEGVTTIEWNTFSWNTELKAVVIPNTVTSIGDGAFIATFLDSIHLPASIVNIGDYAFGYCDSLKSITVDRATPPTLGEYVFYSNYDDNFDNATLIDVPVRVPVGSVPAYRADPAWNVFSVIIEGDSTSSTTPTDTTTTIDCSNSVYPLPYMADFTQCWESADGAETIDADTVLFSHYQQSITSPLIQADSDTYIHFSFDASNPYNLPSETNRCARILIRIYAEGNNNPILSETRYQNVGDNVDLKVPSAGNFRVVLSHVNGDWSNNEFRIVRFWADSYPWTVEMQAPDTAYLYHQTTFIASATLPDATESISYTWNIRNNQYNGDTVNITFTSGYGTSTIILYADSRFHGRKEVQKYPFSLTTMPCTGNPITQFPYTQDFEYGTDCWQLVGNSYVGTLNMDGGAHSGNNFYHMWRYSNERGTLVSPTLELDSMRYTMSFYARQQHSSKLNVLFGRMTDTITVSMPISASWTMYEVLVPEYTTWVGFNAFDGQNVNGDNASVVDLDDITIAPIGYESTNNVIVRDTVIYNITYLDSTVLNIQTIDSTVYNVTTVDSTVYNVVTVDSVVYNITNLDSVVYNINTVDSVVVNIIQSDSIIYFYDTTCATHDTITLTEYLHDTITVTLYDTVTITVHDTVYIHDSVGVDPVSALPITINVSGGAIVVDGAEGRNVQLYDAVGRLIATRQNYAGPVRFDIAASGTYLVKVDGFPARKVVAVR